MIGGDLNALFHVLREPDDFARIGRKLIDKRRDRKGDDDRQHHADHTDDRSVFHFVISSLDLNKVCRHISGGEIRDHWESLLFVFLKYVDDDCEYHSRK